MKKRSTDRWIVRLWKWIRYGEWEVVRTIWPFPRGYGTYLARKNMLLDAGLTKEHAQRLCDELNEQRGREVNP